MLLLHATRAQVFPNPLRLRGRFLVFTGTLVAIVWLLVCRFLIGWWNYRWLGALVYVTVIIVQGAMIVAAHMNRFNAITSFYHDLAQARSKDDPAVDEYVESYRHLREHGSSCAILILEFLLAFVLVSARQPYLAAWAVTLWLLPSIYAWIIGSLLETSKEWPRREGVPTDECKRRNNRGLC